MRSLPRTAISLYVALAVHALALLAMVLGPPSQDSAGGAQGLSVRGAVLSAGERRLVEASLRVPPAPAGAGVALRVAHAGRLGSEPVAARVGQPDSGTRPQDRGATVGRIGGGGHDLYFSRLRAHLAGFSRELRRGLPPARSRVRVAITPDGWVEELALLESSGLPELDAEALDLVRRAAPLPPPPRRRTLRLIVPVEIVPPRPG